MINCLVIGCRHNTVELINTMLENNLPVDAVLTIEPQVSSRIDVSGFVDVQYHIPGNIPVYKASTYNLKKDRDLLKDLRFKVGFCVGWQRLIPSWFLDQSEMGIFGMHASRYHLPGGRGRSPITWSIIENASIIHATVFKYGVGADDGKILDIYDIEITHFDSVHTVQQKARIAFNRIINKHYDDIISGEVKWKSFPQDEPSWYEKRTPASGKIDWAWSAMKIHNFVRAQSAPYPGAFTTHNGEEFRVWAGFPYGFSLIYPDQPGTILEVFMDGSVLVQTGNCPYLCSQHELPDIKRGTLLI